MNSQCDIQADAAETQADAENVLEVRDLQVEFAGDDGVVRVVDGVSFDVARGRTLGLVGESGCGKSVTAFSVLRLIQKPGRIVGGSIELRPGDREPFDILALPKNSQQLFDVRGDLVSMIFQEPMTALSPVHTMGNQIGEAIRLHQDVSRKEARVLTVEMLSRVGISGAERRVDQYPFELSGGMRQRVMIAMALVCRPQLLIADEPTTALDVTIQAQIMRLIHSLQKEFGTSTILITHDLGVVGQMCDDVAVMYLGRIIESGPVREIIHRPRHPYTQGLLASLPSLSMEDQRLPSIKGSVPSLKTIPPGCPFHPRCPHAVAGMCDVDGRPECVDVGPQHMAACRRVEEILHG